MGSEKSCQIFTPLVIFTIFAALIKAEDAGCSLNFTVNPYAPTEECLNGNTADDTVQWKDLQANGCCLNALVTYSQALALEANVTAGGSIFLNSTDEISCEDSFARDHPDVQLFDCGIFQNLKNGQGGCSDLNAEGVKDKLGKYNFMLLQTTCDGITAYNESDTACTNCKAEFDSSTSALLTNVTTESPAGVCDVALLITVAAPRIHDPVWIRDFYRCVGLVNPNGVQNRASTSGGLDGIPRVLVLVMLAAMAVIAVFSFIRQKQNTVDNSTVPKAVIEGKDKDISLHESGLYRFTHQEIRSALDTTSPNNFLGEGSAGKVYKGILPSGQYVAIKHINGDKKSDTFLTEVHNLAKIRHPNLVSLLGYCEDDNEQYLVYEFCCNGNLAQMLLQEDKVLTWEQRMKIARESIFALCFLHKYPDGCIVHRDLKPANILLTDDMDPKLSDFGLSKMFGMAQSDVFTDVKGTMGYLDPEYAAQGRLTCTSDIYSFGIVLLQLLSGRKAIELDVPQRESLVKRARSLVYKGRGDVSKFADPRLHGEYDREAFERILKIAVLCTSNSSEGRPTIADIVEEIKTIWEPSSYAMSSTETDNREVFSICICRMRMKNPNVFQATHSIASHPTTSEPNETLHFRKRL